MQAHYPWTAAEMRAGRVVRVRSPDELPAEAAADRDSCRRHGIRAALVLPLTVGALGLNDLRGEREWPDALVRRLELVAQILTNALTRRRHDLKQRESEERLALAADSAGAGLWTFDFDSGVFWVTERARAIFGYTAGEVVTMDRLRPRVHPEDWDLVRCAIERAASAGESVDVEYRVIPPGADRPRWIHSRGRPVREASGRVTRLTGISLDVTERKAAEAELQAGRERLEAATDLAGLGFYEVDFVTQSVFVDEVFRDLTGLPPGRESGLGPVQFWMEQIRPDDRDRVLAARQRLHAGGIERLDLDYRFLQRDPRRGVARPRGPRPAA